MLRKSLLAAPATIGLLSASFASMAQQDIPVDNDPDPSVQTGATGDSIRFERIATFPVWRNFTQDDEAAAEILDVTEDGLTVVYTDGEQEVIGFVDITDPANPVASGSVALGGEPTSVATIGNAYALAAVNTSADFINVSGELNIIDIATQEIVRTIDLGGQPDAVATSADGNWAVIAIENERDEDLGDGELPQLPAGGIVIVNTSGAVAEWTATALDLTGIADIAPEDPEPEYVDINSNNEVVISLQENNHVIVMDLETQTVLSDFSAGQNRNVNVDTEEEGLITFDSVAGPNNREPDGLAWIGTDYIVTADEGDIGKGGRSITVFNREGDIVKRYNRQFEYRAADLGHYPEERSGNRGIEIENVDYGVYNGTPLIFAGAERANLLYVVRFDPEQTPADRILQALPTGIAPEGIKAIPSRNLVIVASEDDVRDDRHRSSLNIYQIGDSNYPAIRSQRTENGTPLPWVALSGLTLADDDNTGYLVSDSFLSQGFIYRADMARSTAIIRERINVSENGVNLNLDLEGIDLRNGGGFWVVSEGNADTTENMLMGLSSTGEVEVTFTLPRQVSNRVNTRPDRFGFEGVAARMETVDGIEREIVYVAVQREFVGAGDVEGATRIARFDTLTGAVTFAYYPRDAATSPNGGWVGLAHLHSLGNGVLAVLERDNQGNDDAAVKRVYTVDLNGVTFLPDTNSLSASADAVAQGFPTLSKTLVRDLIASGDFDFGGAVLEKIEGLAIDSSGRVIIVNDNDGVDDNNGETQIIRFNSNLR